MTRWVVASLLCVSLVGCDLDKMIEGCGSQADALAAQRLLPSAGAEFDLGGAVLPLPDGYMYRASDGTLELFVSPGVYCDSGDWGLYQKGSVQLRVHGESAPLDPFLHFPATHRGYMREQIDLGLGPFEYSFDHNAITWHVQAFFTAAHHPRVIFMYVRTGVLIGDAQKGLAMHYFPGDQSQVLPQLTAAIELATR